MKEISQLKKYLIIFLSAFCLEIITTFYINGVAEKEVLRTMMFAFITPFVTLPFVMFVVDTKDMKQRVKFACCSGSGYAVGVFIVMLFIKN